MFLVVLYLVSILTMTNKSYISNAMFYSEPPVIECEVGTLSRSDYYIFVGDSRTVGMRKACVDTNCKFIGSVGSGLSFVKSESSKILALVEKHEGDDVHIIFNSGVNDISNKEKYIKFHKELLDSLEKYDYCDAYYVSVLPVFENEVYNWNVQSFNKDIRDFNSSMYTLYGDNFIDVFDKTLKQGVSSSDGLHYSSKDYNVIVDEIKTTVEERKNYETL